MTDKKKEKAPQQVFDYVAVYTDEDGNAKIVKEGRILSSAANKVLLQVAREIPAEYEDKLDAIEVLIRPF
jgi:hypothetical protein